MAYCKECGNPVAESSVFCGKCGAAQNACSTQPPCDAPVVSEQPPPAYEAPAYERPVYVQDSSEPVAAQAPCSRPPKGSPYAVVGTWRFFFSMILLGLPVVGWVFTIVWACGGVRNYNLQRLARAYIIAWIMMILFYVAIFLLGGLSISAITGFLQSL